MSFSFSLLPWLHGLVVYKFDTIEFETDLRIAPDFLLECCCPLWLTDIELEINMGLVSPLLSFPPSPSPSLPLVLYCFPVFSRFSAGLLQPNVKGTLLDLSWYLRTSDTPSSLGGTFIFKMTTDLFSRNVFSQILNSNFFIKHLPVSGRWEVSGEQAHCSSAIISCFHPVLLIYNFIPFPMPVCVCV